MTVGVSAVTCPSCDLMIETTAGLWICPRWAIPLAHHRCYSRSAALVSAGGSHD
jgi:hypothetical protein